MSQFMPSWPGTTMASRSSGRGNVRYFRKPKYISKKRTMAPMLRAVYGRTITVKLARFENITSDAGGATNVVGGLVAKLQASNDWANYAATYSLFNILNVTVQVLPAGYANVLGHTLNAGICYDPKDNVALASYGAISDHLQFKFFTYGNNADMVVYFKFKPKPNGTIPQRVTDGTENFGWVKTYSLDTEEESGAVYSLCYVFTVVFAASE